MFRMWVKASCGHGFRSPSPTSRQHHRATAEVRRSRGFIAAHDGRSLGFRAWLLGAGVVARLGVLPEP